MSAGRLGALIDGRIPVKESDVYLPASNVSRAMRASIPAPVAVSASAVRQLQACLREFIGFVTGEAKDHMLADRRRMLKVLVG
jgi:histone H3/H4